jgi:hypothetical protein
MSTSGEERMKHYTAQEWVDFVRGTVSEDHKVVMQAHLESGCQRCRREAKTWLRVRETASRQLASDPDDSVVRFVKGSFAISGRRRHKHSRGFLAEVLFDSSRDPLPAGVRSAASTARQLLFGAGDLKIDLRIEPKEDSENVSVIGQILNSAEPGENYVAASIALLKAGKVVSVANTNRFGEFQLECGLASRLELRIRLSTGKETSISLVDPVPNADKGSTNVADSNMVKDILGTLKRTRKPV